MKKKISRLGYIIIISCVVLLLVISKINLTPSRAAGKTYTRKQLQDFVVSTGLSYFYNKSYSDYDQKPMDTTATGSVLTTSSMNWRQFYNTPEMVNRANYYHIDCSSFAAITYMHSLGYDFSEQYQTQMNNGTSGTAYYKFDFTNNKLKKYYNGKSASNFKEAYTKYGRGLGTAFYTQLGYWENAKTAGKEYLLTENAKNKMVVYHYTFKDDTTKSEYESLKENLWNRIDDILEPGDIVIYRNNTTVTDSSGTETSNEDAGHAMLYIGDAIDSSKGFIHSTGSDYKINDDGTVSIGDDTHSVRYDGMYKLDDNLFMYKKTTSNGKTTIKKGIAFTILRPINNYCTSDTQCVLDSYASKNIEARDALRGLRTEQYVRTYNPTLNVDYTKTTCTNCINEKDISLANNNWSASEQNSVNVGDELQYTLYLRNMSKVDWCKGSGLYTSQSACEADPDKGYEWITSSKSGKTFNNMLVTATVPANTKYIECTGLFPCEYNEQNGTITWTIDSNANYTLSPGTEFSLRYRVEVVGGDEVVNEGMKIVTNKDDTTSPVLQMTSIKTKINPTMTLINTEDLIENVVLFDKLNNDGIIEYTSSGTNSYQFDLSKLKEKTSVSQYGFVKSIYHNILGIDLGYLSGSAIKTAIFTNDDESNFYKKNSSTIESTSTATNDKINKMLVKGFYGGRYLRGNDNDDREGRLRLSDLEVGDIIVNFYTKSGEIAGTSTMYLYLGTDKNTEYSSTSENQYSSYLVRFETNNDLKLYTRDTEKTSYQIFNELYSKDLFVVLRPSQLYGTTVNYSGVTLKYDEKTTIEYDKYRHLEYPTDQEQYTLTLDYVKTNYDCFNCAKTYKGIKSFGDWYTEEECKNKVTSTSAISTTEPHTLYGKWEYESIELPNPTLTGYTFKGWYDSSTYQTLIGEGTEPYEITESLTLYAKWIANKYKVIYNSNGGSGSMPESSHTYDQQSPLTSNTYTKDGYKFKGWSKTQNGQVVYEDGEQVTNLVSSGSITLYAVWEKEDIPTKKISITIENGTADSLVKTVPISEDAIFTLYPNTGHSNPEIKCEGIAAPMYTQLQNSPSATLKITRTSTDTKCTVKFNPNTYTIAYNANGGTGSMENSTHTYGIASKLTKNSFTKESYDFIGWSKTASGQKEFIDEENIINLTDQEETITLYAKYEPKNYSITYDLVGGTLSQKPTSYNIESVELTLPTPTKNGYIFTGWTGSNGTTPQKSVVIPTGTTGNKNYTANWEKANFKVIYTSDQFGTITGKTEETVKFEESPTGTTKTIVSGYKHLKWATDVDVMLRNGKKIYAGAEITEDEIKQIIVKSNITITAYHYQNKYAIAYNAGQNGKVSGITNEEVAENSSPLGTKVTPNTGYEFSHWIANTNLTLTNGTIIQTGQPVSVDNLKQVVVTTTITFTAQYTKATYTINYTSNEYGTITGITTETKKYLESPTGTTIAVADSEYSFSHWIANKDVQLKDETTIKKGEKITPENISNIIVNSNITFTAQYKKNKYTIYYNSIDDIKIVGQTKEVINNNSTPTGTTVEANNQQKNVAWSCDKDVKLQDGTTIKAGSPISPEQLTKIIVEEDLTFTANYREDIEVLIPDTSLNVGTIIIVISSILILIGSAIIIKNLEKKKIR